MGRGMGGGGGMGRGMGGGGGMVMPAGPASGSPTGGFPENPGLQDSEQELAALKQQAEMLEQQKQQLNQRISQVEGGRKVVAVVDSAQCTGCGICVDVCPTGAIEVNEQAVVNAESCNGCAACVSECPNEAIVIAQTKSGR